MLGQCGLSPHHNDAVGQNNRQVTTTANLQTGSIAATGSRDMTPSDLLLMSTLKISEDSKIFWNHCQLPLFGFRTQWWE
ncbi:hypothetical protein CY34DRAFT_246632 [Suillus luteus UH-Slu-Lm8-n1]|uniref:Uncharacterized protein n=1 Tax=Suillus luteus UH-Slu-Lm8-n1 TaxID=930992 RepID=A0A0D0AAV5_9AGAM|nr:hypothetical protein CY34DRAFT_246632 [Suillus luteus UH-Slu-Lm8-n1]